MTALYSSTERALTRDEAVRLSAAIRKTPNILGYPPKELQGFPDCLIATLEDGTFAGVCLTKHLAGVWSEIAVVYVFPEFRGQGIGTALFQAGFRKLQSADQRILCISREPIILRRMEAAGMRYISAWRLPFSIHVVKFWYMQSVYRQCEAFRKIAVFRGQPAFRTAVTLPQNESR